MCYRFGSKDFSHQTDSFVRQLGAGHAESGKQVVICRMCALRFLGTKRRTGSGASRWLQRNSRLPVVKCTPRVLNELSVICILCSFVLYACKMHRIPMRKLRSEGYNPCKHFSMYIWNIIYFESHFVDIGRTESHPKAVVANFKLLNE